MRTVLIAEDDRVLMALLATELEDLEWNVIEVESGEKALAILQGGQKIDALITDIQMPGNIDGWQLAEAARELFADLPVIYMTGLHTIKPHLFLKSIVLMKPFRIEVLPIKLDALVRNAGIQA